MLTPYGYCQNDTETITAQLVFRKLKTHLGVCVKMVERHMYLASEVQKVKPVTAWLGEF